MKHVFLLLALCTAVPALAQDRADMVVLDPTATYWQTERITRDNLFDVTQRTPTEFWAVGDGVAAHIFDATEQTWSTRSLPESFSARSIAFATEEIGVIVGAEGKIVRSTDGGRSWAEVRSPTVNLLNRVAFLQDGRTGWAVGFGGTILHTQDAGESWVEQESGSFAELFGLHIVSEREVWTAGAGGYGTVLTTRDGGASWERVDTQTDRRRLDVRKASNGSLFTAGDAGMVQRSNDGGTTWETLRHQSTDKGPYVLTRMLVLSPERVLVTGGNGSVYQTYDGGATWELDITESNLTINALAANAEGLALAVGNNGFVYRAMVRMPEDEVDPDPIVDDRPAPAQTGFPVGTEVLSLLVSDEGTVVASTYQYGLFRQEGDEWVEANTGMLSRQIWSLKSVQRDGEELLIAGTWDFGVFVSRDQARTWEPVEGPGGFAIALATTDEGLACAVDFLGQAFCTEDLGDSWQLVGTIPNVSGPTSLLVLGDIILLSDFTGILISEDGAETWQRADGVPFGTRVEDLARTDYGSLYAASRTGIFRSTDEGRSWQRLETGLRSSEYLSILPLPGTKWVVAATWGAGLHLSEDAGETWREVRINEPEQGKVTDASFVQTMQYHAPSRLLYAGTRSGLLKFDVLDVQQPTSSPSERFAFAGSVAVWPQPASSQAQVHATGVEGPSITLAVSDLLGREVYREEVTVQNGEVRTTLSTAHWSTGVYVYHLGQRTGSLVVIR